MPKRIICHFSVIRLAVMASVRTDKWAANWAEQAHLRAKELNRTTG